MAALNRMTGKAENWATQRVIRVVNKDSDPRLCKWDEFTQHLQQTFGERRKKAQSQTALMRISQLTGETVLTYQLRFEELASWSGFGDETLLAFAKKGLSSKIMSVMYNTSEEVTNLEDLWERATSIEYHLKE